MKCIRCGFCCINFDVVIVDPKFVDDIDIEDVNSMTKLIHKKGNEICPHLEIDNKTLITTCKVHDKPWYIDTPCYKHTVIGESNKPCRVGSYEPNRKLIRMKIKGGSIDE